MDSRVLLFCLGLLSSSFSAVNSRHHSQSPDQELVPHCTNEAAVTAELPFQRANASDTEVDEVWWTTHLRMSLNETTCFVIKEKENRTNGSAIATTMHTIKYARLEHRYGIAETYRFGIPAIRQTCKCDCPGGETICSVDEYQYRNCTTGALC
ncbi:hypothetical protein M3Y99_01937100 [Aphelenchoides fujianensis]|nr:hypothetical protein M3Y99_01937100 [Aphelenchoides fujianensis]